MATKEKEAPPPPPAADGIAPKKGKKLIIIALLAVMLLIGIGAAAVVLLKAPPQDDEAGEVDEPKKKKKKEEKPHGPPAYLAMEAFTINLQNEAGDQFLRLQISAQFDEALETERAKQYMPSIRNKILLMLSGKKSSELGPKEGKEKLAKEIREEMNAILAPESEKKSVGGPVREILFTEFVIQ